MKLSIRQIAFCAVIAAVYAALTVVEAGFGSGQVQVRVAEALCVLPFLMPVSMWGLFAGCIIANLVSGAGMLDVVFGSLATLLAAFITSKIKIKWLTPLPAVICNTVIVGAVLSYAYYSREQFFRGWLICGAGVGVGELIACAALGIPLLLLLQRTDMLRKLGLHK